MCVLSLFECLFLSDSFIKFWTTEISTRRPYLLLSWRTRLRRSQLSFRILQQNLRRPVRYCRASIFFPAYRLHSQLMTKKTRSEQPVLLSIRLKSKVNHTKDSSPYQAHTRFPFSKALMRRQQTFSASHCHATQKVKENQPQQVDSILSALRINCTFCLSPCFSAFWSQQFINSYGDRQTRNQRNKKA